MPQRKLSLESPQNCFTILPTVYPSVWMTGDWSSSLRGGRLITRCPRLLIRERFWLLVTARLTSAGESWGQHTCCFGDVIGVTAGGSAFHYQLFWSFPEKRTTGHPGHLWHRHLAQYLSTQQAYTAWSLPSIHRQDMFPHANTTVFVF